MKMPRTLFSQQTKVGSLVHNMCRREELFFPENATGGVK